MPAVAPGDAVLAGRGLTVRYGRRTVLDAVDATVRAGRVLAVLGANGAGKSTLLAVLAGERAPAAGTVTLAGRPLAAYSFAERARARAILEQDPGVAVGFTGREVVALGRYAHARGGLGEADRAAVERALAAVDAQGFADRAIGTLSGGERARIHFARCLAQVDDGGVGAAARALLLDEPAASLDPRQQHAILALARASARDAGTAVLAIVHDVNLASRYADDVLMLRDGHAIADGPADRVLDAQALERCYDVPMLALTHPELPRPVYAARPGP